MVSEAVPAVRRRPPLLPTLAALYLAGLLAWWLASLRFGDRWLWLFLLNCLALYLFLPLPLALAVAVASPGLPLRVGAALGLALFLALYGRQLLPRPPARPAGPALTVMTFNALVHNRRPEAVAEALDRSGADLIALQELTPALATALERRLGERYPYRVVTMGPRLRGMGLWSRYPLRDTGRQLSGPWLGDPQVVEVAFAGATVTVVNVHNVSLDVVSPGWWARLHRTAPAREAAAASLAAFARARQGPLVVLGDFNTVDQSRAYRLLRAELRDAWRDGGFGLGKTFPGRDGDGDGPPRIGPLPLPAWIARIDYIFHSAELQASGAWIGPWDGGSDHRPVVARLSLRP